MPRSLVLLLLALRLTTAIAATAGEAIPVLSDGQFVVMTGWAG